MCLGLAFCVCFCFNLDYFVIVLFVFCCVRLFLQYYTRRLAGKNVSQMTYFVYSGTQNLNTPFTRHNRLTAGLTTVLHEQPLFVQPVVKQV